jgi:hypothetical protein
LFKKISDRIYRIVWIKGPLRKNPKSFVSAYAQRRRAQVAQAHALRVRRRVRGISLASGKKFH